MGILDRIKNNDVVNRAKELIKKVYLSSSIPWVIGYSGGKDSTCTTQIVISTLIEMHNDGIELKKPVYVISADTMVETPMIIQTISNMIDGINKLASSQNLPISGHIVHPKIEDTFWSLLIGKGYPCPNQTFRWCTDRMKINPANNFITSIVDEFGEAIMILGVRDGESHSRDRVLENHTIEGYDLMRHTTMANAYVFAPIREFTIDDVWSYLLNNPSPWGMDNNELYKLYSDSSEDCPLMVNEEDKKSTCGNSRFGCWVCTVVSQDKSLSGFIKNGVEWLRKLLEFRDWLYSIRDEENMRMYRGNKGDLKFVPVKYVDGQLIIDSKGKRNKITISRENEKWVDNIGNEWNVFDSQFAEKDAKKFIAINNIDLSSGNNPRIIIKRIDDQFYRLGMGPFTMSVRHQILEKLLILQKKILNKYKLITDEELIEIKKNWLASGDWEDEVSKIYVKVFDKEFLDTSDDVILFDDEDIIMLKKLVGDQVIFDSFLDLLYLEKEYIGFNNRIEIGKRIKERLNKEILSIQSEDGTK